MNPWSITLYCWSPPPPLGRRVGLVAMLGALVAALAVAQTPDEEYLGRLKENAGKLTEAFEHYRNAFNNAEDESRAEQRLQEKLIRLAAQLPSPPPIPEVAEEHLFRGQQQLNDTTYRSHWRVALGEFRAAMRLAPWWWEPYAKMALAYEGQGYYSKAIAALRLSLLAQPPAEEAAKLKARMHVLQRKGPDRPE